jgi:uncharacterized membrane protein YhaH (DUF805 family)
MGDEVNWYLKALRQYADFSGRARRKEYWLFLLINIIIAVILGIVDGAILGSSGVLGLIFALGILIPSFAVAARRLHDTGRSGWWLLIQFVPVLGSIVLIVFFCLDSEEKDNQYGPNPKFLTA